MLTDPSDGAVTLILAFTSDTTAYAAEVPYEVSQASVAATQCGGPGREPNSPSHGPLKLGLLPGVNSFFRYGTTARYGYRTRLIWTAPWTEVFCV